MGKKYLIDETTLTGIADSIREKNKTTNKIDPSNFANSIRNLKGKAAVKFIGQSNGIIKNNLPFDTTTYVGNIVFDLNKNPQEFYEICKNLLKNDKERYYETYLFLLVDIKSCFIYYDDQSDEVYLGRSNDNDSEWIDIFAYSSDLSSTEEMYGFTGWNPEFNGIIEVNSYNDEGILDYTNFNGADQETLDYLNTCFWNETEGLISTEMSIALEDEYDGSNMEVTENKVVNMKSLLNQKKLPLEVNVNVDNRAIIKSKGTVVENEVDVENIYFNTYLSVEEVIKILDTIDFTYNERWETDVYIVHATKQGSNVLRIIKSPSGDYGIDGEIGNDKPIFCSIDIPEAGITKGWRSDFINPQNYNNISMETYYDGTPVGRQNDKLTDLFSTTPFIGSAILEGTYDGTPVEISLSEDNTIDLIQYINNGKLPLKIKII